MAHQAKGLFCTPLLDCCDDHIDSQATMNATMLHAKAANCAGWLPHVPELVCAPNHRTLEQHLAARLDIIDVNKMAGPIWAYRIEAITGCDHRRNVEALWVVVLAAPTNRDLPLKVDGIFASCAVDRHRYCS